MHILGTGVLTWNATERRSDRYGTVYIMQEGHNSMSSGEPNMQWDTTALRKVEGLRGTLIATVITNRQSTHIGDFFRGVYPSMPEVGEIIHLGEGTAFIESQYAETVTLGLKPDEWREHDWLDINALYRAHEQTVTLTFEELSEKV